MPRRRRILVLSVAGATVLALAAAALVVLVVNRSEATYTIDAHGGSAGQRGGVQIRIARGVLTNSARISIDKVNHAQTESVSDSYSTQIGAAVEIGAPEAAWGSMIVMPLDRAAQLKAGGALTTPANAYIAVWSTTYGTWIPLETTYSAATNSLRAIAPHFSQFSLRSVKEHAAAWTVDAGGAVAAARTATVDAARIIQRDMASTSRGSMKRLEETKKAADRAIALARHSPTVRDLQQKATAAADAARRSAKSAWMAAVNETTLATDRATCPKNSTWSVTVSAPVAEACVSPNTDGSADVRLTETGFLRYLIDTPKATNIRPNQYDLGIGPADMLTRLLHYPVGDVPLPARGKAQVTLTKEQVSALQQSGNAANFGLQPDYVGVAIDSGLAALMIVPPARFEVEAVARVELRAVLASVIRTEATASVRLTSLKVSLQVALRLSLDKRQVDDVLTFVTCISTGADRITRVSGNIERFETAIKVGKDCAALVLKFIGHSFKKGMAELGNVLSMVDESRKTALQSARLEKDAITRHDTDAVLTVVAPELPRAPGFNTVSYVAQGSTVRPASLGLFNDGAFRDLDWTTWDTHRALATATQSLNACDPDCASGTYVELPVSLVLDNPVLACGHLYFSELTVTAAGRTSQYPIAPEYLGVDWVDVDHPGTACEAVR